MGKQKTHEEFVKQVYELVGDEYTVLSKYEKSALKIRVKHNTCREEYDITPNNFLGGNRCKKCGHKEISERYTKTDKEFIDNVRKLVGDEYIFLEKYVTSSEKIKVRHNTCGYEYKVAPSSFNFGHRCKKCGDKNGTKKRTKTNDDFLKEVYELVGDEYIFLEKYKNNGTSILVEHKVCGHRWKVQPSNFVSGAKTRCPECFGNERKTIEQFKGEVSSVLGVDYEVTGEYVNSNTKIGMLHKSCGNRYEMLPLNVTRGQRCPMCKASNGERVIAEFLNSAGVQYEREVRFSACRDKRSLPFDFGVKDEKGDYCLLIEFDGEHHFSPINHFGGDGYYEAVMRNDNMKNDFCISSGFKLLRIPYWDVGDIEHIVFESLVDIGILKEEFSI